MSEPGFSRILAFDCSGSACSAAVWTGGRVASEHFEAMARGQAEALLPQVKAVMAAAGLGFDRLDAIATTVGPGSFTGLRIGLAAARGLALASGKPIVALTAFEAVLAGIAVDRRWVAVAIDSRRGPLFVQRFGVDRTPIGGAVAVERGDLAALLPPGPGWVAGDGIALLDGLGRDDIGCAEGSAHIRAADVARAAAALGPAGIGRLAATPLYLRPPDATQPRTATR